ncbi:MAG TPA: histidine kinase [Pseudonocardiaceae bacterium]|nr:histidine kinase [Pseudonocardiaceae bacterium]
MPGARWLPQLPSRSDLLLAVAWFALGAAFYVTGLPQLLSDNAPPVPLWQRLILLGIGCLVVLERRRAPLLCLVVAVLLVAADGFIGSSLPILLVLTAAIYNAVRRGSRQLSLAVLAGATVATILVTAGAGVVNGDWRVTVPVALQAGLFLLLPVWWATEVRQRRELAEAERVGAAQQTRIAELDRHAAISAERTRMARDLHDVIAGHLSAIALQSEAGLSMAAPDPGTVRTVLASVRESSVRSLAEMKAMIELLRAEEPGPPPTGVSEG